MQFVYCSLHDSLLGRDNPRKIPSFVGLKLNSECEVLLNLRSNKTCRRKYDSLVSTIALEKIASILYTQFIAIKITILDQITICKALDRASAFSAELDEIWKGIYPLQFVIPNRCARFTIYKLEPYIYLLRLNAFYNQCNAILDQLEYIDLMDQRETMAIDPIYRHHPNNNHVFPYCLSEQIRLERISEHNGAAVDAKAKDTKSSLSTPKKRKASINNSFAENSKHAKRA